MSVTRLTLIATHHVHNHSIAPTDALYATEPAGDGDAAASVVSLRALGLDDTDAFVAWASDPRVMRFLKRPLCATREQAVAQIRDTVLGHPWGRSPCGRTLTTAGAGPTSGDGASPPPP
jgi:hypothetical protein